MRILFFTSTKIGDYLSDSLLHGLRAILGGDLVDFPKKDAMYKSFPEELAPQLYGRGFTLYRTLDDIWIDRFRVVEELRAGRFDAVVFGDIWNQYGYLVDFMPCLQGARIAIVDGEDSPAPFPYAGSIWRTPYRWMLPRVHRRFAYFKREITPDTLHYRLYRLLPKSLCEQLPPLTAFRPIAFSIPEDKVLSAPSRKTKRFPAHIVDRELIDLVGGQNTYAFAKESEYYADLQASQFGVTMKRAGWDCLRHYELAANAAVPCFRALDAKPARCAPHGLSPANSLSYDSASELLQQIEQLDEDQYATLQRGTLAWARANTTRARATAFIKQLMAL